MKNVVTVLIGLIVLAVPVLANGTQEKQDGETLGVAAAPQSLVVIGHRVHNTVTTGGPGGDIVADWLTESGVGNVEWITLGIPEIHDRLFREASLPSGSIDVGFVLNTNLSPAITSLFEPLDEYLQQEPIEELEDIFPGLREAARFDGQTFAIPFRHATSGLHYNEQYFNDRGVGAPFQSIEELIEAVPKLTFRSSDGTEVYGFVIPGKGQLHANHVDLARAWNGDFITLDYRVTANEPGMVNAIRTMRDFYSNGYLPQAWTAIENVDLDTWIQQGRVAMTFSSTGRNTFYNNPEQSRFPGAFRVAPIPISRELAGEFEVAPAKTEFWSMVIPRNARNKQASWDFIRYLSRRESTVRAALNGNGPVRSSTYDDAQVRQQVPYWETEQRALEVARVPLPGFDRASEAADLFNEYAQLAILGRMDVQEAMDRLTEEVEPLLPQR